MKFATKDGRIAGKISVIDATIVIGLVAILGIYAKLIAETVLTREMHEREIMTFKLRVSNLSEGLYEKIKNGSKIEECNPGFHSFIERADKIRDVEGEGGAVLVDSAVWFKTTAYTSGGLILYGPHSIKLGYTFDFRIPEYDRDLYGCVMEIVRREGDKSEIHR